MFMSYTELTNDALIDHEREEIALHEMAIMADPADHPAPELATIESAHC